MASNYPASLDVFTTGTLTGTVGGADHGNKADALNKIEAELGVLPSSGHATVAARFAALGGLNVKDYGAVGSGSTDQTSIFNTVRDAAGVGGMIIVPPGTYYLKDFTLLDKQSLVGFGGTSILGARPDATYAVRLFGVRDCTLRGLWIDGVSVAGVKGVLISGSASASSQGHLLEGVRVTSCPGGGISVEQGTVSQADKNTYINCHMEDTTKGMLINSVNAQEQVLINCTFDGGTHGIEATAGSLHMLGGQFQGCSTAAIKFSGSNVQQVRLEGVITEGCNIDIDGSTQWPSQALVLDVCVMAGDVNTVKMGVGGANLIGHACRFNNTPLLVTGTDCVFYDEHCSFTLGATIDASGGAGFRRQQWSSAGLSITRNASVTLNINEFGTFDMLERTDPSAPATNHGLLYTRDNGSGKTQLVMRFPTGAIQVIATEP